MGVVPVRIRNSKTGASCTCFAMLDACANVDLVDEELVKALDLTMERDNSTETIHTVAGNLKIQNVWTDLLVSPIQKPNQEKKIEKALVQKCDVMKKNRCPTSSEVAKWEQFISITSTDVVDIPRVLILISIKQADLHKPLGIISLSDEPDGLFALETSLGPVLYGGGHENKGKKSINHIKKLCSVGDQVVESLTMGAKQLSEVYDNA